MDTRMDQYDNTAQIDRREQPSFGSQQQFAQILFYLGRRCRYYNPAVAPLLQPLPYLIPPPAEQHN